MSEGNDMQTDPDGYTNEDFNGPDWLLDLTLAVAIGKLNESGEINLVLNFQGAIVSGTAVGAKRWVREWTAYLGKDNPTEPPADGGEYISDAISRVALSAYQVTDEEKKRRDQADLPLPAFQFVHLTGVTIHLGTKTVSAPFWRGRLSQVSGWTVGAAPAGG